MQTENWATLQNENATTVKGRGLKDPILHTRKSTGMSHKACTGMIQHCMHELHRCTAGTVQLLRLCFPNSKRTPGSVCKCACICSERVPHTSKTERQNKKLLEIALRAGHQKTKKEKTIAARISIHPSIQRSDRSLLLYPLPPLPHTSTH